jgi:hypothetical protein
MWRTEESAHRNDATSPPIAPTQIVGWSPIRLPSAPPRIAPSGIVPHTMNRIVAFIFPCIRGGVIAWRSETWLMFQATLAKPPKKPERAQARERSPRRRRRDDQAAHAERARGEHEHPTDSDSRGDPVRS